jgi:hypothetical protein
LQEKLDCLTFSLSQIELLRDFCEHHTARCIPLQQHSESGLNERADGAVHLKAPAGVTAFTRLQLSHESWSVPMLMVEQGGAYPIRKKDFGLLDPIRPAGEAEDLKGRIIRCNQIQSGI